MAEGIPIGLGVDIVPIARIEAMIAGHEAFVSTVYTEAEIAYCRRRRRSGRHFAARFAAKEAVLKALGTGLGKGMDWTDVEVVPDPFGRPKVKLSGGAAEEAQRRGIREILVSLSHSDDYAIAQAMALSG